jgi:hypothetical protein
LPGEVVVYVASPSEGEIRQGEIISDLIQARLNITTVDATSVPKVERVKHPYAIIVSQDCDLLQDFRARSGVAKPDKMLPNILFCEVTTAVELCLGGNGMSARERELFVKNKVERYHFLQKVAPDADALREGLPELGIDFKRYFSVPTDEVYKRLTFEAKRRCYMNSPYFEHLS